MDKLKSILSLLVAIPFSFAFCFVVWKFADTETAKTIISAFITVATNVIGFFIGYQTSKKREKVETIEEE